MMDNGQAAKHFSDVMVKLFRDSYPVVENTPLWFWEEWQWPGTDRRPWPVPVITGGAISPAKPWPYGESDGVVGEI